MNERVYLVPIPRTLSATSRQDREHIREGFSEIISTEIILEERRTACVAGCLTFAFFARSLRSFLAKVQKAISPGIPKFSQWKITKTRKHPEQANRVNT